MSGFALRSLSGSLSGPFVVVHDSSFCDVRSARSFRSASFGWAAGSRSRAIRPALAPHVVHSCEESGELGHLPSCLTARRPLPVLFGHGGLATLQGAQRFALGLPGTRGARPGGDPGPFDRCLLLTDSVLKELSGMLPKSRCTPQRIFPRAGGAHGSRRGSPLRRASSGSGALSSPVTAVPAYL